MINNDYIKGYLAALRTIQATCEYNIDYLVKNAEMDSEALAAQSVLNDVVKLCKEQRKNYKELVDKLNEENE